MGFYQSLYRMCNLLPTGILNRIRSLNIGILPAYLKFRFTGRIPLPVSFVIGPSTVCNLKCPLCPTGIGLLRQEKGFLSLKMYKKILKQIPSMRRVSLFNWGESFLNPEILDIIKFTSENNIFSTIHTNFSFTKDYSFFTRLAESGLNRLSVSLDGASRDTYSKYRIGGDFDLVYDNLVTLIGAKKETGSKLPRISLQFIVHHYNESELEKARKMARDLGILFSAIPIDLNESHPDFSLKDNLTDLKKEWLPANNKFKDKKYLGEKIKPHSDLFCYYLFSQPVITHDGNVYPCCKLTDENSAFGNINYEPFEDIWNNESFTAARNLFSKRKNQDQSIDTICHHCQCGCGEENSSTSPGS